MERPAPSVPPRPRQAPAQAALAFFFVMAAYYIIRPVRDQLGGAVGSAGLPLFYSVVLLVMFAITPVFGLLVARFRRRRVLVASYSFFILCLLAFVPAFMLQQQIGARLLGAVFYTWISVFNLFVVSLFWSFMADIFDSDQARVVFPRIALGGMAGAIGGPLITGALVRLVGVAPLLAVSAAVLGAALVLLLRLSAEDERRDLRNGEAVGGSPWAGLRELWSNPFVRYMALLMLFGDGIGTLAYALVADYVHVNLHGVVERTAFYNGLDLATNALGVLLQLTLTPWLLRRQGPVAGLVLTAAVNVSLLLAVALLGNPRVGLLLFGVPLLGVVLAVSRGFTYGMAKPAQDALYTRVPREVRYKGKNFVETTVWRFGDVVVTSAVSGLLAVGAGLAGLGLAGAGVAALSAWAARRASHTSGSPERSAQPVM